MKKGLLTVLLCGVLTSTVPVRVARADPDSCRDAIDHYKYTLSDLADSLRRYSSCVADSRGKDDCSSEFSSLRNEQDDFESAVTRYRDECN